MLVPEAALSVGDAMGEMMRDFFRDGSSIGGVVERSDGYMLPELPVATYFTGADEWPTLEREATARARGRVLDLGCGAGRHSIHLQANGHDVLGIDSSRGAVEVARARGLHDARRLAVQDVTEHLGRFDTVLMMCNNFGLAGSSDATRALLRNLAHATTSAAQIIAHTVDPHLASQPEHRAYRRRNVELGRMPGQITSRIRYRTLTTPWTDLLYVSPGELEELIAGTGWRVVEILGHPDPNYFAILTKQSRA